MDEQLRLEILAKLNRKEDLPREWARRLFPPDKRESELVYFGKEREEEIISETMAVPLQPVRTFGSNGRDWNNMLIFGDNLQVLKRLLEMKAEGGLTNADGSSGARLIYIDPPFSSKREFKGTRDQKAYQDKIIGAEFLESLRKRLVILREILADDGYLFVHLDQKKSHYVKILLDEIMGEQNFLNHIIWSYRRWPSTSKNFQSMHDDIFFYAKKANNIDRSFLVQYEAPSASYLKRFQGKTQILDVETGTRKITIDEPTRGLPMRDVWELSIVAGSKGERTAYPTQKPESLLARIIETCTKKGDLVLDSFVGSGTTCAVAEKLNRRWIGIDVGKLAIYSTQKRLLNLKAEIGHNGKALKAQPFTLYNAGLYDFSSLRTLPWSDWRFFALKLFECRDEPHEIGGLHLDGKRKGSSVLVFKHLENSGKRIDEQTISEIHAHVGKKIGSKMYIIAPSRVFDFQQDYLDIGDVRYYAMRIPYSIIHELHSRDFSALEQPKDELAVNETVDAVGFDFIQPPKIEWQVGVSDRKKGEEKKAFLRITKFESRARIRSEDVYGGLETLSMVMLDYDYQKDIFDLDEVFYGSDLETEEWHARFPYEQCGQEIMAVFIDIHGNEARHLIPRKSF